jgi:phospholipid transport system substrate-binding protein
MQYVISPVFARMYTFVISICVGLLLLATPAEASADAARGFVQGLSDKVLAVIQSKASESEKEKKLVSIFEQSVDTAWMGRFAMGQHFKKLSEDKKAKYLGLYKDYLIQSYIPRFKEYTGEKIKIVNVRPDKNSEYFVQTEIVHPDGRPPVLVDYRLRENAGSYKLVDIIGEGISLITTQRSDFGGAISQGGVDGFIEKLEARVKANKKN